MQSIRVITEDIKNIKSPRQGDVAMDTDTSTIYVFDGMDWQVVMQESLSEEEVLFNMEKVRIEQLPKYDRLKEWEKYQESFRRRIEEIQNRIVAEKIKYRQWKTKDAEIMDERVQLEPEIKFERDGTNRVWIKPLDMWGREDSDDWLMLGNLKVSEVK